MEFPEFFAAAPRIVVRDPLAEFLGCWRSRKTDHRCSLKIDQGRKLAASAASVG